MPINLSIVQGSEYVSFYYRIEGLYYDTFEPRGDNITVSKSELDNYIVFKQDIMFEGEESKLVKIQAEWAGVIRTDSIRIYPKSRYFIRANIEEGKDSIYNGDQVKMILYGTTDVGCGYCTPLDLTYNAEIIKGGKYGNLSNFYTGERGQSLTDLWQYTLGPGQPCGYTNLNYIADGVEPEKADSIVIRFSTSDPQIPPTDTVLIIKPSPIKVTIIPSTISAGDTAEIIIQKRNVDGSVENCPPEQPFEIGMVDGCMLGNILACSPWPEDSGACFLTQYFWGVNQTNPIYFIADSSADSGTVEIRAGLIENWESWVYAKEIAAPDTAAEQTNAKKLAIKQVNNKFARSSIKKEKNSKKKNIADTPLNAQSLCFNWEFDSRITTDAEIMIVDCNEEIEYALENKPQKISEDKHEIKLLRSDDYWLWTDKNGLPQIAQIGDPIYYGQSDCSGVTLFLKEIVYNSSIKWTFGDDLKITTLLDTKLKEPKDYMWIFNVSNLRIPILSDLCKFCLTNTINLGDGTDTNLLAAYITNDSIYNKTIYDLDIFIDGPYKHQFEKVDFGYYPGILLHEQHHFLMKKRFISQYLDSNTFPLIRKLSLYKSEYPCPENTKFQYPGIIKKIKAGILIGGTLIVAKDAEINISGYKPIRMKQGDHYVTINVEVNELEADKYASGFYKDVKNRIKEWWKSK